MTYKIRLLAGFYIFLLLYFFAKICKITAIAGSSKGRTWAFEAQYLGSIPSPAAKLDNINNRDYNYIDMVYCDGLMPYYNL